MKSRTAAHLCVAGVLAWGAAAAAQGSSPSQAGASAPATQAGASAAADQATITGCVVSESDYRKAHDEGKGGVVGTGVGAGNEFILTDASAGRAMGGATGTSGTSSGTAYELSGSGEGQLSRFVGKRVELTGKFKAGETSAAGRPTGGPTAGAPPSGVDVGGKDLKLREFEVASAREASGNCSTVK
jgi:hypothetical protein